jgi:hypothetical protein
MLLCYCRTNDSMVNYDCCDNLKELYRMGYIDNHQVFLQRTSVYTDLPVHLRDQRYCMSCGEKLSTHLDSGNLKCLTVKNGKQLGYIVDKRRFDPNASGNEYVFNLVTGENFRDFNAGDPYYPEPITVGFCPYCGTRQDT